VLILPAIDIIGGQCVRLTEGDYGQKRVYDQSPVEAARQFADQGAEWLHVVDLDGAKSGRPDNLEMIREIAQIPGLKVELGGGIRSRRQALTVLDAGVDRVILGSALLQAPDEAKSLFKELGERVVAGIDMRDGMASVEGWLDDSDVDGLALAQELAEAGCQRVIATDIATDGRLQGPNLALMAEFAEQLDIAVIASGGVSCLADLEALSSTGVEGVIIGKALYEGRLTLQDALKIKA
jgi:phosphoribosylformimino-5-aminoimidazole carboxamide ribotide isomerase